jgi:hypothetical protein
MIAANPYSALFYIIVSVLKTCKHRAFKDFRNIVNGSLKLTPFDLIPAVQN